MHTPSHTFIAVKLDTTGNVLRKPFDVVKKFSIVVTPDDPMKIGCFFPTQDKIEMKKKTVFFFEIVY